MRVEKKTLFIQLLTIILITSIISITGCITNTQDPQEPDNINKTQELQQTRQAMGTIVTIKIIGPKASSQSALDEAFDEISTIEDTTSPYKQDSEISRLNKEGYINGASPDLLFLIERSINYGTLSNGAFDITIQPVLDLWKTKISAGEYPDKEEINKTLTLVNYSNITINNDTIAFNMHGMAVTLGGIAKGYAVDRAVSVLKEEGYLSGLVNAGNKSESIVILNISDMAVATSGNYERYFNESARLSHISDPRDGYSCQSLISATVIATSAMEADTLATTIFVLGPVDGIELIERIETVECLLITSDRNIIRSSGFSSYETV
ncbi:MAG: thiamine biosynthesis lipoprotein ApbE [ANME-2 cluster archaeon HR1]|nr:MAG: thiamine biosynthesis lipoprotein ApbE [ANME-2 cluster archaeon HR1]